MHGSCQPCTSMLHLSLLPMRLASCPPGLLSSSFTYAKRTDNTLFIGAVLYENPEYKTIESHRYGAPPARGDVKEEPQRGGGHERRGMRRSLGGLRSTRPYALIQLSPRSFNRLSPPRRFTDQKLRKLITT